jgi:hypothetical protein
VRRGATSPATGMSVCVGRSVIGSTSRLTNTVSTVITSQQSLMCITGTRDDNRPENLEFLTASEHASRHPGRGGHTESIDAAGVVALYRQGLPTTEIARAIGYDNSAVYRCLQRHGALEKRTSSTYAKPLPSDDQLRAWHSDGVRVGRMVALSGVGRLRLERRLDALGLPRFGPGNPNQGRESLRLLTNEPEASAA